MSTNNYQIEINSYLAEVQKRADKIVDKFVIVFFVMGLAMAPLYQTWFFSISVGGLNVLLYILSKYVPNKTISRHIISSVFAIFMLQFIGQSHGMAELHFFFFTNIAILIIYQDWRIMIPYTILTVIHHSGLFLLQLSGYDTGIYFITYAEVDFKLLFFHYLPVVIMAITAGLWAEMFRQQSIRMIIVQEELKFKNEILQTNEEEMRQNVEELQTIQEALVKQKEELERKNIFQKAILDNSPITIITLNTHGFITSINRAVTQLVGYEPAELIGQYTPVQLHDRAEIEQALAQLNQEYNENLTELEEAFLYPARKHKVTRKEWTFVRKDGSRFIAEVYTCVMENEQGELVGYLKMAKDITEIKEAEACIKRQNEELIAWQEELQMNLEQLQKTQATLAESNQKLESIFSEMEDVIWSIRLPDFQTIFVTPSVEHLYEVSMQEWLQNGNLWQQFIHPEDKHLTEKATKELNEKGFFQIEYRIITSTGKEKWIEKKGKTIYNHLQQPTRIDLSVRDITERKQGEEQIKRLSLVASKTNDAILIKDKNLRVFWVNEGFERLTGYTLADLENTTTMDLLQGPETSQMHLKRLRHCLEKKIVFSLEIQYYKKNKETFWADLSGTPIFDEQGNFTQYIILMRNITKRKQLEKAIQQNNEELKKSLMQVMQLREESEQARREIEQQRDDIIASINYAKRIQKAILPRPQEVLRHLEDFMIFYMPRDIISGDFYWFAKVQNDVFLAVGDCTGHGVPGALMTIIGSSLLEQIIKSDSITEPQDILTELDTRLLATLQQTYTPLGFKLNVEVINDGMDIALVKFNPKTLQLTFAGAKRPLWIFRPDSTEVQILKGDKYPIGSSQYKKKCFTQREVRLQKNSTFYIFTDGYADQFGEQKGKYTIRAFREFLIEIYNKDFEEQKQYLKQNLLDWQGTEKQTDDI
ncbi:MAG: PAS domain S-box protein, partial [Microscillaceae bacterium]|nr:PAS domain S-box protein [Microscillaceae bacterium]MDW8461187.1 PAS domain S-box protein [Cytophagales bacterium]